MHLQSTDIQGACEAAFLDELSKIAEAHPEDNRWVTKQKLKRLLLTVAPAAAIGTGLGYGSAHALNHLIRRKYPNLAESAVKRLGIHTIRKYAPIIGGGMGMIGGGLAALQRRKVQQALEGKHERSK